MFFFPAVSQAEVLKIYIKYNYKTYVYIYTHIYGYMDSQKKYILSNILPSYLIFTRTRGSYQTLVKGMSSFLEFLPSPCE